MAHLDEDLAEPLHRLHHLGRTQPSRLLGHHRRTGVGQRDELGSHQRQEAVAQVPDDVLGERTGIATLLDGVGDGGEGTARVELDERLDELAVGHDVDLVAAGGGEQLEGAQRVARRPAALLERGEDAGLADVEAGVGRDPADVLFELVHRQQVEPQVLGAAADRVAHLLRIGGGQDEHHVGWRLLEGLEQRRLRRLGEHVDLVEDVHLVAAGGAERRLLDEVAHRVHTVVARRVQLVDVVAGAPLDREAGVALAARLAVDRPLAVEHLGQDAGRGGLARAPRTREQVGLTLAVVDDGVAQGPHDVLLAADLAESAGSVPAVERLGGHRSEPIEAVRGPPPAGAVRHPRPGGPRVGSDVRVSPQPPDDVMIDVSDTTRTAAAHVTAPSCR
ncbi:unannotated protein [freshwater metagenome]|uniref:Unannotated protein n=1 Tax=freshwater metagenome TaxID=449393 RepID=A0A6J6FZ83_9ZZZZ